MPAKDDEAFYKLLDSAAATTSADEDAVAQNKRIKEAEFAEDSREPTAEEMEVLRHEVEEERKRDEEWATRRTRAGGKVAPSSTPNPMPLEREETAEAPKVGEGDRKASNKGEKGVAGSDLRAYAGKGADGAHDGVEAHTARAHGDGGDESHGAETRKPHHFPHLFEHYHHRNH